MTGPRLQMDRLRAWAAGVGAWANGVRDAAPAIRTARLRAWAAGVMDSGWWVVHLLVTAVPAWFAFILATDLPTFALAPASFRVLADIATEAEWSAVCAAVAALGFLAFVLPVQSLRVIAAGILAAWHGGLSLSLFAGNPSSTGTGVYALLALASTLAMIERARDP